LFGNPGQFASQLLGVGVAVGLGFGGTLAIMKVIKKLTGVRVSSEVEDQGLDVGEHAEEAYADEEEFKLESDDDKSKS